MTPVKYKVDYAFLIDSGQVLHHMKYLIWGLVISILLP